MSRITRVLILGAIFGMTIGVPASVLAEGINQVVIIDTMGKTDELLSHAQQNTKIFERLGIKAERRYLQAQFAGDQTGSIAVVIEYPDLASLAAAQEKLAGDAEWQKYIEKFTATGMTVRSNSTWRDITP